MSMAYQNGMLHSLIAPAHLAVQHALETSSNSKANKHSSPWVLPNHLFRFLTVLSHDLRWNQDQLCSLESLFSMWTSPTSACSLQHTTIPTVSLTSVNIMETFSDKVFYVSTPMDGVLKTIETTQSGWTFLYHELRQLLSMPAHPHIIPAPLAAVCLGETDIVCGFIMPKIKGCTLDSTLTHYRGNISLKTKVRWCIELISAIKHISAHGNGQGREGYYAELKLDNIMISGPEKKVVLIDFESLGSWRWFTADEASRRHSRCTGRYENPDYGALDWWATAKKVQREKAMVYALGVVFVCIMREIRHEDLYYGVLLPLDKRIRADPGEMEEVRIWDMTLETPTMRPSLEQVESRFKIWMRQLCEKGGLDTGI